MIALANLANPSGSWLCATHFRGLSRLFVPAAFNTQAYHASHAAQRSQQSYMAPTPLPSPFGRPAPTPLPFGGPARTPLPFGGPAVPLASHVQTHEPLSGRPVFQARSASRMSSAVAPELGRWRDLAQPTATPPLPYSTAPIATPPPPHSTASTAMPPLQHSHDSYEDQAAAIVLSMLGQRVAPSQRLLTPPPPLPPSPPVPPEPLPPFSWCACHNLISTDGAGVLVRQPSPTACPAVKLHVRLLLPLLYSAERRTWLWHKKWRLPKLQVHATCNGKPVGVGLWAANGHDLCGEPPVYVVVSAGTLRDVSNGLGLYDQGLSGDCQKRLIVGEATFSSLLFQNTSFNCGNRPFHLVVTVLAPASHPLAVRRARWNCGLFLSC